jgi:hypothetical protein
MKRMLVKDSLVALVSLAGLGGCGLFGPKETAGQDAGVVARPRPAGSASAPVTGLSFAGGEPFQGEITMTVNRQGHPPTLTYFDMKGTHVRMRTMPPSGDSYVLVDTATWKIESVSDPQKKVTVMNLGRMLPGVMRSSVAPVKTGALRAVAGYVCDVYSVDVDGGDSGEACVARGLRFPALDPMVADLGGDGFPLRILTRDATGKERSHMEVTRVETTALPDSLFIAPPGYKSVDMHDLIKGSDAGR